MRVPADQYNPAGFTDAGLETSHPEKPARPVVKPRYQSEFLKRASRLTSVDERGGFQAQAMPPPGDPERSPLPLEQLSWTLACDGNWKVCLPVLVVQYYLMSTNSLLITTAYLVLETRNRRASELCKKNVWPSAMDCSGSPHFNFECQYRTQAMKPRTLDVVHQGHWTTASDRQYIKNARPASALTHPPQIVV